MSDSLLFIDALQQIVDAVDGVERYEIVPPDVVHTAMDEDFAVPAKMLFHLERGHVFAMPLFRRVTRESTVTAHSVAQIKDALRLVVEGYRHGDRERGAS